MPHYDYVCDACEHAFELYQSIKDDPKTKCPECGKKKLRRLIGPGGAIVFKGSGFYTTDYRSESYKKGAAAEKSANAPEKSTEKSGDKPSEKSSESGGKTEKSSESGGSKKEKSSEGGSKKNKGGKKE